MREWRIPIPVAVLASDAAALPTSTLDATMRYEIAVPHLRDIAVKRGEISAVFINGPHHVGVIARWTTPKAPHGYHWFVARLWEQGEEELTKQGL